MTMKMILSYPGFFAAAYPVCEPYADSWISDAQIAGMKGTPIWFTQAKNDTTVDAARGGYVLETHRRLVAAGAKNVHLSYWDKVEDLSGKYFEADGKTPYEYYGHWSWVYTLNNQCAEEIAGVRTTIMEWLAAQSK
jgi:predicted peptidase